MKRTKISVANKKKLKALEKTKPKVASKLRSLLENGLKLVYAFAVVVAMLSLYILAFKVAGAVVTKLIIGSGLMVLA